MTRRFFGKVVAAVTSLLWWKPKPAAAEKPVATEAWLRATLVSEGDEPEIGFVSRVVNLSRTATVATLKDVHSSVPEYEPISANFKVHGHLATSSWFEDSVIAETKQLEAQGRYITAYYWITPLTLIVSDVAMPRAVLLQLIDVKAAASLKLTYEGQTFLAEKVVGVAISGQYNNEALGLVVLDELVLHIGKLSPLPQA